MKFRNLFMIMGLILLAGVSEAQVADGSFGYYNEALLFGRTSPGFGSTARIQGIGGAQVSLGADMSTVGSNPAGLGFFNRSVFSFTPNFAFHSSNADYFGSSVSSFRNNFNFGNIGAVFNTNKGDYTNEKFKGGSFAISLQRINDFNNEVSYQGRNPNNSITDSFIEDANSDFLNGYAGTAFNQFLIENADGYLYEVGDDGRTYIYPDGDFEGYTSLVGAASFDGFLPRQSETIKTSGHQNAINFAWGGNYDDRVYFGGGISFESLRYRRVRTYTEDSFVDVDGNSDDLLNLIEIRDELTINGSGINFSGGLIVRPVNYITIGVNYRSPTYYSLNEEGGYSFTTDWNENYTYYGGLDEGDSVFYDLGKIEETSDLFISDYTLRTPGKLNVGATFFFGKAGFISGDVEFVDYGSGRLKSNDFSAVADNQSIGNLYENTINVRLGSEFRLDNFRFRAGYAAFGDPFADRDFDENRRNISFGVGYRNRDYFVDLAFINSRFNDLYSPYFVSQNTPTAEIDNMTNTLSATVGFNF